MKKLFLFGVLLAGAVAVAAASVDIRDSVQLMRAGAWFVKKSQPDLMTTGNKLTGHFSRVVDYDFAACPPPATGISTLCNQHTPAFWLDGGAIGDTVTVTSNRTIQDGGLVDDMWFDGQIVLPNQAVIRAHYAADDAGAYDALDASYTVRVFSSQ